MTRVKIITKSDTPDILENEINAFFGEMENLKDQDFELVEIKPLRSKKEYKVIEGVIITYKLTSKSSRTSLSKNTNRRPFPGEDPRIDDFGRSY